MNFITIGKVILTLVPIIAGAVQQAEAIAIENKEKGIHVTGEQKMQLAVSFVKSLYESTSAPIPFDDLVVLVKLIVGNTVDHYNLIGAFVKSAPVQKAA
jgi:hypothetical protein